MNMPIKHRSRNFSLSILLLAVVFPYLSACGPQNTKPVSTTGAETTAKELLIAEDYEGAAQEYLRLARLYPEKSRQYQFKAVDLFILAENKDGAIALLEQIPAAANEKLFIFEKKILKARIALLSGLPEQALQELSINVPEGVPPRLLGAYYSAKAEAYEKQSRPVNAASERIKLQNYLNRPRDIEINIERLWYDLNSVKVPVLEELRNTSPEEIASWAELAIISQTLLFKPEELRLAIISWSDHYPAHPAQPAITEQILKASEELEFNPERIALLLPLTGQFKKASEAIRDGFLAAWLYEKKYKPEIRIYSADSLNITQIYQTVVNEGADFIVGPLEKNAIKALSELESLPVVTLALNQLDTPVSSRASTGGFPDPYSLGLIQFGLSPEDEARQIAQQGIFNGYNKVLVIAPANEWGERLASAFSNEWKNLGGVIAEQVNYDPFTKDFITPVKRLLNIDSSEFRIKNLRQRLSRNIKGVDRIREDIDVIFMAAAPLAARQIVPQFRFFRIEDIPVYTTSHAYAGTDNPQANVDMNGVEFIDMPWILTPETRKSSLQMAVDNNLAAASSTYRRLYAFGVDAFKLIPHLKQLSLQRSSGYSGVTGELFMKNRNLIQRKLLWARIVDGKPELVKFVSTY